MDPPPFPGGPITAPPLSIPLPGNLNYADSADSSPRSRNTISWDEPQPHAGGGGKLRLMCSYGGHIIPRPHDKSLCYVGGNTRILVADRNTSLTELCCRLSKTLLAGKSFCLKYQLQNEDLDSLISVTSDEDLENMIDEYDRIITSNKISRFRLFLFPSNEIPPIGLIRDGSSEDWFVNVLNGANNSTNKVSSSVNCLLGLDHNDLLTNVVKDAQLEVKNVETTSSFGSGSSMPLMVSLPPIKVHVEENNNNPKGGGIDEQFSQMNVGVMGLSSPPESVVSGVVVVEQTVKQQQQLQPKPAITSDLSSPNSVSSEGSCRQRHYFYQEPVVHFQSGSGRISGSSADLNMSDSIGRAQVKQVQDGCGYALPVQYDHQHSQMLQPQQYVHAGQQYIQHTPSGPVAMASYYPMYPSQHQTHPQHPGLEHQYPVYFIPARPGQGYSLSLQQTNYTEPAQTVPPTRSQTPPTLVSPAAAPQLVQINPGPHQPQYVNYSQIHHPSQSVPPTSAATANYAYDFADPTTQAKIYYSQPLAPQLAAQYQTMTSGPTVSFAETSAQLPVENLKQQQIRTS